MNRGRFIVIEGLEGAGKSTALATVADFITQLNQVEPVRVREPGGTELGEALRSLVKRTDYTSPVDNMAELLIMYASRAQLVGEVIQPALERGDWVLADRHDLSSQAYQGGGRGMNQQHLQTLKQLVLENLQPDLTLYLDIEPSLGLARARGRGELDRIELQNIDFFERTRARYLELAEQDESIHIVDAGQSLSQVQQQILSILKQQLSETSPV